MNQDAFFCLDDDDRYIYGSYNSLKARMIYVALVKCQRNDDYCRDQEEIDDILALNEIVLISNQIKFD